MREKTQVELNDYNYVPLLDLLLVLSVEIHLGKVSKSFSRHTTLFLKSKPKTCLRTDLNFINQKEEGSTSRSLAIGSLLSRQEIYTRTSDNTGLSKDINLAKQVRQQAQHFSRVRTWLDSLN